MKIKTIYITNILYEPFFWSWFFRRRAWSIRGTHHVQRFRHIEAHSIPNSINIAINCIENVIAIPKKSLLYPSYLSYQIGRNIDWKFSLKYASM